MLSKKKKKGGWFFSLILQGTIQHIQGKKNQKTIETLLDPSYRSPNHLHGSRMADF